MVNTMWKWNDGTELYHHGIKGQKWGQRRFQYEDGSLTAAGKDRYLVSNSHELHSRSKKVNETKTVNNVQVGKKYSNKSLNGLPINNINMVVMSIEGQRKNYINNVDKTVDQIYNSDSPYAKYYSKDELATDLKRELGRYSGNNLGEPQEIVEEAIMKVLVKANDKIKRRERAEKTRSGRNPAAVYTMLKKGPGRG